MTGRVAILGLGARGAHWAGIFLAAGWEAQGFDPDDRAGRDIAGGAAWRRAGTITGALSGADWVLCCLPDRLDLLRAVLQRAQASAAPGAVIAVVSAAHDIDTLQGCAPWAGSVVRLIAGPGDGLALDVNGQTTPEIRSAATQVLAVLSATAAVQPAPRAAKVVPLARQRRL